MVMSLLSNVESKTDIPSTLGRLKVVTFCDVVEAILDYVIYTIYTLR